MNCIYIKFFVKRVYLVTVGGFINNVIHKSSPSTSLSLSILNVFGMVHDDRQSQPNIFIRTNY